MRRRAVLTLVAGVAVAAFIPGAWWVTHRVTSVGTLSAVSLAEAGSAPTDLPPTPSAPAAVPKIPTQDATLGAQDAAAVISPTAIGIPALSVNAQVVPVGVQPDQQMEIPQDVATVGWYRYGPAPGSDAGAAVFAGHVDDKQQGIGAFYSISALNIGDKVEVSLQNGNQITYQVTAREVFAKKSVPWSRVFDRGGAARIVLITCGGAFDGSAGSYVDNILITAVPVSEKP